MKTKILYISPFVLAFIIVTGGIIYLNSVYNNIFKFDFTPKSAFASLNDSTKINLLDSLQHDNDASNNFGSLDSLNTDSLKINSNDLSGKTDSLIHKDASLENQDAVENYSPQKNKLITNSLSGSKNSKEDSSKVNSSLHTSNYNKAQKDTSYNSWLKNVTSIYEAMEPKKAAKIIQNYSDNIARDILYTMKKKNAAKVVAELNPEVANRIFRFE